MSQTTTPGPAPSKSTDAHPSTGATAPASGAPKIAKGVASKVVWLLLGAVLFSPIATAVGIYVENKGWLDFLGRPPTVQEQLEAIRGMAADDGRRFAVLESVRLHDSSRSYLVILTDSKRFEFGPTARSDEVRIYDAVEDDLALRFRFLPQPRAIGDPTFTYPYFFRFDKAADIDGDGLQEILGSYAELYADSEFRIPVVLGWDPATTSYRFAPLLSSYPRLGLRGERGLYGRAVQSVYRDLVQLVDELGDDSYAAFVADEYAWARDKRVGSSVLLAAYTVQAECNGCPHLMQVVPWTVQLAWPIPEVVEWCRFGCLPGEASIHLTPTFEGGPLQRQIFRAWHTR